MRGKGQKTIQVDSDTKLKIEQLSKKSGLSQTDLVGAMVDYTIHENLIFRRGTTVIRISADLKDKEGVVHRA